MGRNKNRDHRSASRKLNGHASPGNSKRDSGLPNFFKERRLNNVAFQNDAKKGVGVSGEMEIDSNDTQDEIQRVSLNVEAAAASVAKKDEFLLDKASRDLSLMGKRDSSTKAFMKDVKNVIENSDVILQVLDARDPLGCRSRQTEIMAMSAGKKVVLILNKVDLIPIENLQGWLRYLRNDFPTLAFKASTQQQRSNLKQGSGKVNTSISRTAGNAPNFGTEAVGASALLQLLKNYSRTSAKGSKLKQQLTVGVIGPPNVGKSSLINSLLRTRACAVASTPGWTKVIQGVMLEKGIRLLDCPGVVVTGLESGRNAGEDEKLKGAWNALRNTVKVELIEDPITPIQALISRVDADQLNKLYSIEGGFNEGDAQDFLLRVALMRGKLAKGGLPDVEGAARIVLHDWNIGRISYHTQVPALHPSTTKVFQSTTTQNLDSGDASTTGASLLGSFGEAFDLVALLGEADAEAFGQKNGGHGNGVALIKTREKKLPPKHEENGEAIAVDDDEERKEKTDLKADCSASISRLGKRNRRQTLDDDSESESNFESGDTRFHLLKSRSIHGDDNNDDLQEDRKQIEIYQNEYHDRKLHKAESIPQRKKDLLTVFSEQELENMAERRSDVRKAAKKRKKRNQRSEAGLVDIWEKGLEFPQDKRDESKTRGLFDVSPETCQIHTSEGKVDNVAAAAVAVEEEEEEEEEL